MLQRALSDEGLEFRIMSHETATPTGLLRRVIRDTIRPLREETEHIVRELLGHSADDDKVRLCAMSVIGPCLHVLRRRRMRRHSRRSSWMKADKLEVLVEHFAAFALGGIEGLKRRRRSSRSAGKEEINR